MMFLRSCVKLLRRRSFHSGVATIETLAKDVAGHRVCVVSLNRPPVNSVDESLALDLSRTLSEVDSSGEFSGIILTSSVKGVFSAGLDLKAIHGVPGGQLKSFWNSVQDLWLQLYSTKLPTVAAINGHCLAAGTILAASCDYRMAVQGSYKMGVPAAKIGLVAPRWFMMMLTHLMGQRRTELALQQGTVFEPNEAKKVGLVDEVIGEGEDIVAAAIESLKPFLRVSQKSRAEMKLSLRNGLIADFKSSRERETEHFISFVLEDSVQNALGKYIAQLQKN